MSDAPSEKKAAAASTLYAVLLMRADPELLDTAQGEQAKTSQLQAVAVAVESGDKELAARALEVVVPILEAAGTLTDAEKAQLADARKRLETLAAPE